VAARKGCWGIVTDLMFEVDTTLEGLYVGLGFRF
jgi:hypothetical protein